MNDKSWTDALNSLKLVLNNNKKYVMNIMKNIFNLTIKCVHENVFLIIYKAKYINHWNAYRTEDIIFIIWSYLNSKYKDFNDQKLY